MTFMEGSLNPLAETMTGWFREILHLCDQSFFGVATDERHRKAAILNVLARNAKILVASEMDREGELFEPLCLTLAAACRLLAIEPSTSNWRAALQNVFEFQLKLRNAAPSLFSLGLSPTTSAAVFKQHLDEALVNAGVTDRPTILDQQNRLLSLGLAINWGMRFLLAYALETLGEPPGRAAEARDLSWIRALLTRSHVEH
jgi:hypothetical protein